MDAAGAIDLMPIAFISILLSNVFALKPNHAKPSTARRQKSRHNQWNITGASIGKL
jgi:hypothetical protein